MLCRFCQVLALLHCCPTHLQSMSTFHRTFLSKLMSVRTASVGDVCALRLTSTLASDSSFPSSVISRLRSTEKSPLSFKARMGQLVLDPLTETMLEVRVYNTGTETETFSLQINSNSSSPISLVLDSSSSVSVEAGASGMWTLKATAAEGSLWSLRPTCCGNA